MICVNCDYTSDTFNLKIAGLHRGSLTYKASCPHCGSEMVNPSEGVTESELRIKEESKLSASTKESQ